MEPTDLTTLAPYPAPLLTLTGVEDDPAVRESALDTLTARPWATYDWPTLLDELRALGRTDIPLGRLVEGHADALRILAQLGATPAPGARYGVWASRSHATGVRAEPVDGGWRLTGTLRFASGAGVLDRALVPAWVDDAHHQLLDVDVTGWQPDLGSWRTGAMAASRSYTIPVDAFAPADAAVGELDAYLRRPGFFPGGIGVAAVWAGGAARVADLTRAATAGAPPTPVRTARWGRIRVELAGAAALLDTAGRALADGRWLGDGRGQELSTEVRAGVARSARVVVEECRALAGPAGVAYDADLAQALDDLTLYVAQENEDVSRGYLGAALAPQA